MNARTTIIELLRSTKRNGIENVISLLDSSDINRFSKVKGHGWRSVELLTKYCGLVMTKDEWNTIRYHMRRKDDRPDTARPYTT